MKITSNSSLPTSNISPMVARRSIARYSPRLREDFSEAASDTVKKASAIQMILNSDVSGVITSIPPNSVALRGSSRTAPTAITRPSAATAGQSALIQREFVKPIARTTSAVRATIASGETSLRSSR